MVAPLKERREVIDRATAEMERWDRYVDTLVSAFQRSGEAPPALEPKLEELRHKRDSVVTKLAALRHHERRGFKDARHELERARSELRNAWRSVIGTLSKDGLFV